MTTNERLKELVHLNLLLETKNEKALSGRSWEIKTSQLAPDGRGIFALKDIKAGEVIYREKPLLTGPPGRKDSILHTCTLCYKVMEMECLCPKGCTLPICKKCEFDHQKECDFFLKWEPLQSNGLNQPVLRLITAVRAMLLSDEQKELLFTLQGNSDEKYFSEIISASKYFKRFPSDKDTLDILHRIISILNTNAIAVSNESDGNEINFRGLYPITSMMNHDCSPNTTHYYTETNKNIVKATRLIPKGQEITTTYTKLTSSTKTRQLFLKVTKHFTCHCKRCLDPTENGTYLGALYCPEEKCKGFVLPNNPLDQISQWKCQKCSDMYSYKTMTRMQSFVFQMMDRTTKTKSIKEMISFINNSTVSMVPPNNHLIVESKLHVVLKMDNNKNDENYLRNEEIKKQYCKEIIEVLQKLNAGDCILNVLLKEKIKN